MVFRDHPCTQDCPDRTSTCRLTCSKWKEYVEQRDAHYKKRSPECIYNQYILEVRMRFKSYRAKSKRR